MKIKPLRKYNVPDYPSKAQMEENPEMLENLPMRWTSSAKLSIIMGVGIMSKAFVASPENGDGKSEGIVQAQAEEKIKKGFGTENVSAKEEPKNSIVAPVLAKALENDGRGAFGCVAVNPPTFLSEPEALEIIKTELEKGGLNLKEDVVVDGVACPNPDARYPDYDENGKRKNDKEKIIHGKHTFDFASDDGRILIEFLSRKDYSEWEGHSGSSVQDYDFPDLVKTLSDEFGRYKGKKVFGIFFEPLASSSLLGLDLEGIDDPEPRRKSSEISLPFSGEAYENSEFRRKAQEEYRLSQKKEASRLQEKDKAKLREQVAFFVDYLKKNGYIGK